MSTYEKQKVTNSKVKCEHYLIVLMCKLSLKLDACDISKISLSNVSRTLGVCLEILGRCLNLHCKQDNLEWSCWTLLRQKGKNQSCDLGSAAAGQHRNTKAETLRASHAVKSDQRRGSWCMTATRLLWTFGRSWSNVLAHRSSSADFEECKRETWNRRRPTLVLQ